MIGSWCQRLEETQDQTGNLLAEEEKEGKPSL